MDIKKFFINFVIVIAITFMVATNVSALIKVPL